MRRKVKIGVISGAVAMVLLTTVALTIPKSNNDIPVDKSAEIVEHVNADDDLAQMASEVEPTPFAVEEEIVPEETYYTTQVEETSHYAPQTTTYSYTPSANPAPTYTAPSSDSGNFQADGVWYDENYRYTWYSSNAAYHYRTPEWTAGSDGVYRDSEGYVIVASSDHAQGTVIENTPFGPAKVYDTGCASGTLDIYTNY